jgi:phenylalanyl-tRNA synthetase beta subunit
LLEEICQAKVDGDANDQLYGWPWIWYVGLRLRRAEAFLGTKLDEKQIINGLKARGFDAEHFSLSNEAKKHIGKPYVFGASYKKNLEDCFDCSYLVERIYSKIGVVIGHTAEAQYKSGKSIEVSELKPGDLLFYSGHWDKLNPKSRGDIGHVGMYLGGGNVLEASQYSYNAKTKKYDKLKNAGVRYAKLSDYTNNPSFKGARRYIGSMNHIIAVVAPWWRSDITTEVDLIEEAAKILGYENLLATLPELPTMQTSEHQMLPGLMGMREDLVAQGLFEITSYSFVSAKDLQKTGVEPNMVLSIENPMSHEQAYLRNSLLSSHLQTAARNNTYYQSSFGYFEIARAYQANPTSPTKADENWHLAVTAVGQDSLGRLKGILDMLSERYGLNLIYSRNDKKPFVAGRGANIISKRLAGSKGSYGQLLLGLLKSFDLSAEVSFAEIVLPSQAVFDEPVKKSQALLPYQLINRDVTVELNNEILWQTIKEVADSTESVKRTVFIEEFSNDQLSGQGRKKVSLRIWLDCGAQPKQEEIARQFELLTAKLLNSKMLGKIKI